jgi:hypothetical protein
MVEPNRIGCCHVTKALRRAEATVLLKSAQGQGLIKLADTVKEQQIGECAAVQIYVELGPTQAQRQMVFSPCCLVRLSSNFAESGGADDRHNGAARVEDDRCPGFGVDRNVLWIVTADGPLGRRH